MIKRKRYFKNKCKKGYIIKENSNIKFYLNSLP